MGFFAGRRCYLEHGTLASRVQAPAKGQRLYVQLGMAEREMQSTSLKEAQLACRRLELEAKESVERAARAKAKRDVARHEATMAKLEIEGAVNTRAHVESELISVQRAFVVAESARPRVESERGAAQEAYPWRGKIVGR